VGLFKYSHEEDERNLMSSGFMSPSSGSNKIDSRKRIYDIIRESIVSPGRLNEDVNLL
jgi:hypothetical protein